MDNIPEIKINSGKYYSITGKVKVIHPDGTEEIKEGYFELCACAQSKNKPWCDGTHKKIKND